MSGCWTDMMRKIQKPFGGIEAAVGTARCATALCRSGAATLRPSAATPTSGFVSPSVQSDERAGGRRVGVSGGVKGRNTLRVLFRGCRECRPRRLQRTWLNGESSQIPVESQRAGFSPTRSNLSRFDGLRFAQGHSLRGGSVCFAPSWGGRRDFARRSGAGWGRRTRMSALRGRYARGQGMACCLEVPRPSTPSSTTSPALR